VTSFGLPHLHLRLTDSTNERARELAVAGAPSGTVITAAEQSAGRGRRGRAWSGPAGKALLYTAVLRPLAVEHALLPLTVPLATCAAIESLAPVRCEIKWPNDVWIDRRKVAGVLIEARPPEWAVIGVGINVAIGDEEFPSELRWPAISIGHGVTVEAVHTALSAALGDWVTAPAQRTLAAFDERDALRGRAVSWEGAGVEPGAGVAAGIDGRGNIVVERDDGERLSLGSGEVSLRLG
jgi:BirA family biotin operon repressor/biotin-[acetyl-CoA-carboxylase] ligase